MAFQLTDVVPWGRTFDEYAAMFALDDMDRSRSILGCGDGPASFNVEMSRRGSRVISVDPLYRFSAAEIAQRIHEIAGDMVEGARRKADAFLWTSIPGNSSGGCGGGPPSGDFWAATLTGRA